MAVTQYIGARYVPLLADPMEWSSERVYEPLTIVLHQGNSYTSRQAVPRGVDIANTTYWAPTGNYNAQLEQYRQEVKAYDQKVDQTADDLTAEVSRAKEAEETITRDTTNLALSIDRERERAIGAETKNADGITANASAIAAETERATKAEDDIRKSITTETAAGVPACISMAMPVVHTKVGQYYSTQGSAYVEGGMFAVAYMFQGSSQSNQIRLYSVTSGQLLSTYTMADDNLNSLSAHGTTVYCCGSHSGTSNISRVYELSAAGGQLNLVRTFDMDPSGAGFTAVNGFGWYDEDHYWLTESFRNIYLCDTNHGNVTKLCAVPFGDPVRTWQGGTYDYTHKLFIYTTEGCATFFDATGKVVSRCPFEPIYNGFWTGEVEELSYAPDLDCYFFNSNSPVLFQKFDSAKLFTIWRTRADGSEATYEISPGTGGEPRTMINVRPTNPEIQTGEGNQLGAVECRYAQDALAIVMGYPNINPMVNVYGLDKDFCVLADGDMRIWTETVDLRGIVQLGGLCRYNINGSLASAPWTREALITVEQGIPVVNTALPTMTASGKYYVQAYQTLVGLKGGAEGVDNPALNLSSCGKVTLG